MEKLAHQIKTVVKAVPGTSSAYAERVIGGYYLDVVPDREALARYGLMISDVQDTVSSALGGETITTTVEGRERYGVNLRYPRDLRSDPQSIARDVLVAMLNGGSVPRLSLIHLSDPTRPYSSTYAVSCLKKHNTEQDISTCPLPQKNKTQPNMQ